MVAIVPKEDSDEKDEIEVSKFVESSDIWKPYLSLLTEKTDNKRKPYTPRTEGDDLGGSEEEIKAAQQSQAQMLKSVF